MRRLAIIASIALLAACNPSHTQVPPTGNAAENIEEPDANVIGYDQCGEPIYEGQTNHPVNTPCR
jgi:hypothetical protein